MNTKIKAFEKKIVQILSEQKESIINRVKGHITAFETLNLTTFTNEKPYDGQLDNTIFFTYSDHYEANSGTYMQVGELNNPHVDMDDRGYIKGVATDLNGYLALRSAKNLSHNADVVAHIYFPKFIKSKNSDQYYKHCSDLVKDAIGQLDMFIAEQIAVMNAELKSLTGCSLLYYIRNI